MLKVFLAIGFEDLEYFLKQSKKVIEKYLNMPVEFVGETVYREGIMSGISYYQPDIIVIREGLKGSENLTDIIYNIKMNYPDTRIIFLAGDREVGDALLANLVQLGVYDLIIGSKIDCTDIIKRIIEPRKLSDVIYLLPKISVDERTNKPLFEAPQIVGTIKQELPIKPIKSLDLKGKAEEEKTNNDSDNNLKVDVNKDVDEESIIIIDDNISDDTQIDETNEEIKAEIKDDELIIIEDDIPEIKEEESIKDNVEGTPKENFDNIKTLQRKSPFGSKRLKNIPINKEDLPKPEIKDSNPLIKEDNKELIIKSEGLLKSNTITRKPSTFEKDSQSKGFRNFIFGGKKEKSRITQQIITFMGGKTGVGNSQVSFNVALNLAENGYKVIYLDLNDKFSSIDYLLQLGYTDAGIDTAFKAFEDSNYNLIDLSTVTIDKILANIDSDNFLYKTYSKLPKTLDFMFFSQKYMERFFPEEFINEEEEIKEINPSLLKDLNMYLLMTGGYDYVILDVPSDINNKVVEYALIYSSKIFFTVTQDVSIIGHHISDIKIMNKKGINYRDKFYYLLNKYENASMSLKDVYLLLSDVLKLESFNIVPIPNISKDIINSNYSGTPVLWNVKSKEFKNAFSEINKLIIQ